MTVQFVNGDSSGATTIDGNYEAGFSGVQPIQFNNQAVVRKGRWAGATLVVRYLGYLDANGAYHGCDSGSPALEVKIF